MLELSEADTMVNMPDPPTEGPMPDVKGRRTRPTSTRTGGRNRPVVAVILLILIALVGGISVWFTYDVTRIYGDPLSSDLGAIAPGFVMLAVALNGVAALAIRVVREGTRRLVSIAAGVLVVASLLSLVLANHNGLEAKRLSGAPPECGIGNASLNQEFQNIDHPGYFGGGSTSTTDCTFLMTTSNIASALAAYDERLTRMGYQVTHAKTSLTATRDGFEFTATAGTPFTDLVGPGSIPTVVPPGDAAQDNHAITVILRETP